jgi:6-phosphogluconolactonase (cycloisomerase 2 family)
MNMAKEMRPKEMSMPNGGHLYMQTNEIENCIIHYHRAASGALSEVERCATGGAGSGTFKPISGQDSAPNAFEGAGSVILTPDRRFLFATNGGDNSVSSFRVGEGKLSARPERYTVNTHDKPNRVSTMVVVSPDEKFVFVGTTFDEPIVSTGLYPDGSPILWVQRAGGAFHSIASNTPDPDGLAVFPLREDGSLGTARFYDGGGGSPFYIAFLHGRPNTFVIGYAVGDGVSMGTVEADGKVNIGPLVKIDTSAGLPSELCWLSISPDDRTVFATNFGYSNISSYHINARGLEIACDPACPKVPGDGTARGLNGTVSSGPSDNWITPDGAYLYQIYGNASKLVGYATQRDGSLEEITSVKIPYNSPQGLAGF